jgi:hypothetical protein
MVCREHDRFCRLIQCASGPYLFLEVLCTRVLCSCQYLVAQVHTYSVLQFSVQTGTVARLSYVQVQLHAYPVYSCLYLVARMHTYLMYSSRSPEQNKSISHCVRLHWQESDPVTAVLSQVRASWIL